MLGNVVVSLCLAIILGVIGAWLVTRRSQSSRSKSHTTRDEAAKERPTRQG
jgi:hypothetical protein